MPPTTGDFFIDMLMPRNIKFSAEAFEEISDWIRTDVKVAKKIVELLTECARTPFEGKGKPEGLKGNLRDTGHVVSPRNTSWFIVLLMIRFTCFPVMVVMSKRKLLF